MLGVLKQKSIVRVIVVALLFTMVAWMVPANVQKADAVTANLKNPRIATDETATWDCVWFGHYPQSSNGHGGFNNDPIKWRVLCVNGDEALLLADKNLDCKKYNEKLSAVTWETSTVRSWLNGSGSDSFLGKAFTSREHGAIYEKTVQNPNNPEYGTAGGNATRDKVFFLSIDEVTNPAYGFPSDYIDFSETRRAVNTEYAESQGAYSNFSYGGTGHWWLRSLGDNNSCAAFINHGGSVCEGGNGVNWNPAVARPALRLNIL